MLARRWLDRRTAVVIVAAIGMLVSGSGRAASRPQGTSAVRFHHAHYHVGDPSAAMDEAVRRLEGVRVIVQGLGVGVRAGSEFVLFDRAAADDGKRPARSAAAAYPAAVEWLASHGLAAEPALGIHSRVAAAMGDLPVDHLAFVADDFETTVQRLSAGGAPPAVRRDASALFETDAGLGIEIVRDTDREETFWCPMHPDVRSADEGKCPICGMGLVPIPPPRIGEYKLDVTQIRDGETVAGLTLAVREPETNALTTKFALVHEKRLHLFLVSRDLTYFAHVHPEPQPNGRFTLRHAIPAGEYMLIADFLPEGGTSQMIQKAIIATGSHPPAPAADETNGLKVTLNVDGDLAAGKEARLRFSVADAASGEPVTDLQPYLGAPAHMLIVRSDLSDAIHGHPEEQATGGPEVSFHPIMPAPGEYRLWIQFQRGGQVSTTAFDLTVKR